MTFETALHVSQSLLGVAILQRAAEHLRGPGRWIFALQAVLATGLLVGVAPDLVLPALWGACLLQLHRFHGPYNGGADKMAMLIVTCLACVHLAPSPFWSELAFAYLALQLVLSYAVSGWVKLVNSDWRQGTALRDVFAVSAYPVSTGLRGLAGRRWLMRLGSWAVIGFELAFPFALVHVASLSAACGLAALFHLANACLFGLNRFFWIWPAAFPALFWFQDRFVGS